LEQTSVRRDYSYTKKEFIDARPDQPNSNTLQLIKTIQSGLNIKINKETSKSPGKTSQFTASDEYSDEVIDELTVKLRKQMEDKKKRER
jgi:hypothetical protein